MLCYAKIYRSMFEGSLRGQSDPLLVFINILTACDATGIADRSHKTISDETGLSVERVRAAAALLESSDPSSRSKELDGARIERLDPERDWGWSVVNFTKYRDMGGDSHYREVARVRQQRRRQKLRNKDGVTLPSRDCHKTRASASASASVPVPEGGTGETQPPPPTPEPPEVELPRYFPKTVEEAVALGQSIGVVSQICIQAWDRAMSRGGRDSKDVPIRNFASYLKMEQTYDTQRRAEIAHKNGNGNGTNRSALPLWRQIDNVKDLIARHPANHESTFYCSNPTESQKQSLADLKAELDRLNAQ